MNIFEEVLSVILLFLRGIPPFSSFLVAGTDLDSDFSFTFAAPLKPLTPVPMIRAVLPSNFLKPLYNVTIRADNKFAALRVDNLHYTIST